MISVIIPTYKNKEIFLQNLTHNLHFLTNCEIIIVNDNPEKSLKDLLNERIILIENKKNLGFGQSVNRGVTKAKGKFIMLLNDDVRLIDNNYQSAITYFAKNNSLFAVSFAQKEKDNKIIGKNVIYWQNGLFFHKKAPDLRFGNNAWVEGGSCLIDRNKFIRLGGFDEIYSPFYWEDVDLSYRAWKQGYQIIFEPKIIVNHQHGTTINKFFTSSEIKKIAFRNQFLFIWKNINDSDLLFHHLISLPYNLFYYSLKKEPFLSGFFAALRLLSVAKSKKYKSKKSDKEILNLFKETN